MTVRWSNVAVLALLIVAMVFLVTNTEVIREAFSSINNIGNSYATQEEQFRGVFIFALIGLVIVAVTKIIVESNRNDGNDD